MGVDHTQDARVTAGGMPSDDPTWGRVSAFLDTLASTYPEGSTAALEATHLAAMTREARRPWSPPLSSPLLPSSPPSWCLPQRRLTASSLQTPARTTSCADAAPPQSP